MTSPCSSATGWPAACWPWVFPPTGCPGRTLQKEVDTIVSESGIQIQYNSNIDNVAQLKKDYDAVLVAVGASEGKVIPTKNMVDEQNTTRPEVPQGRGPGRTGRLPASHRPRHQGAGVRRRQRGL